MEVGKALIDGIKVRKSIELINAIYKSNEIGREVFYGFNLKIVVKEYQMGMMFSVTNKVLPLNHIE